MRKKIVIVTAVITFSVSISFASGPDTIGFGSRPTAMGGAYTAISEDYTAVYYNPAGLGFAKDSTIGLGYSYSEPQFKDVGDNIDIPLIRAINIGVSSPLGTGKISKTISIGLGIYNPTSYMIRVRSLDPKRRNYIMFENRANRISVFAGASYKPLDSLSIGVGVELLAGLTVKMALDPTRKTDTLSIDSPMPVVAVPYAGVMFRPFKFLSLGFAFRGSISVPIELPATILLFGEEVVYIKEKFTDFYKPHEISLGAAYFYKDQAVVSAEVTWLQYSKFIPPVPEVKEVSPQEFKSLVTDLLGLPEDINPHFKDIWQIRVGGEFWALPYIPVRAGYSLRPSPVPEQKGSSNYMDSTVHIVSFGTGVKFKDPFGILSKPVSIDAYFQTQILTERTYSKDSQTYGEAYSFSGQLYTFGLDITYRF